MSEDILRSQNVDESSHGVGASSENVMSWSSGGGEGSCRSRSCRQRSESQSMRRRVRNQMSSGKVERGGSRLSRGRAGERGGSFVCRSFRVDLGGRKMK